MGRRGTSTADLRGSQVAVYARFSSDRQRETSIEEQVERCRRFIEERGGEVTDELTFADFAISGASLDRPGFEALMRAVEAKRVDLIVTEDVSRVSRDIADAAAVFKRLQYLRVPLLGVGDGIDTSSKTAKMTYTLKSLVDDMYLDGLRDKTKRAMEDRARAGMATGGLPFGFKSVPRPDGRKDIEIDEEAAAMVRRIFSDYASGKSRPVIAQELNAEGIDPPRSTRRRGKPEWRTSTIRAILLNPRYIGVWTFNETTWVKVPGTNKRRPQKNPPSEVIRIERPELRVVDQNLWDATQTRVKETGRPVRRAKRSGSGRRRYLLSGLVHCGTCGALLVIHGGDSVRRYYRCSDAHSKGTCENRESVRESKLRRVVVGRLRERFLSKKAAQQVRGLVAKELGRMSRGVSADVNERRARLARTEDRIRGLITFIADGDRSEYTVEALRDLEAQARTEKATIERIEQEARTPVRLPSPDFVHESFLKLGKVLDDEDPTWGRRLLGRVYEDRPVVWTPDGEGGFTVRMGVNTLALLDAATSKGGTFNSGYCGGRI